MSEPTRAPAWPIATAACAGAVYVTLFLELEAQWEIALLAVGLVAALIPAARRGLLARLETASLAHPRVALGSSLAAGLAAVIARYGIRATINRCGSMMTLFFGVDRVHNAAEARLCDAKTFASFFHGMLQRGIYWPPAAFEAAFISLSHSMKDLEQTVNAFADWAKKDAAV